MKTSLLFVLIICVNAYAAPTSTPIDGDNLIDFDTNSAAKNLNLIRRRTKRAAIADRNRLWDFGIIPYVFDEKAGYTADQKIIFSKAMQHWEENTCIKFIERNPNVHKDFIRFSKLNGCFSHVGKMGFANGQDVSIGEGCDSFSVIVHELAHAVGFQHEHQRPDRDDFIQVNYDNIKEGFANIYKKFSADEINSLGEPYDYNSIMHYVENGFSKNGLPTIVPKFGKIGPRKQLSESDIIQANRLYKCAECRHTLSSQNASFTAPNYNRSHASIPNPGKLIECEWNITVAREERIKLNVTDLMIFNSTDCQTDYLEISVIVEEYIKEVFVLGRFCGTIEPNDLPKMIVSPGNQVIVKYVSTHLDYRGFAANYEAVRGFCGGDMTVTLGGGYVIESPNYPETYPANKECIWRLSISAEEAPWDFRILLEFETFDLESNHICFYDFVEISFGDGSEPTKYCGNSMPKSIHTPFNVTQMEIHFKSDVSYQGKGFSAKASKCLAGLIEGAKSPYIKDEE